jgi:transcriptional regulator with XRE-family HTH domain
MELAKRIKSIRKAANLTQGQVSAKLGITQPSYSELETKAGNCAFYTLQKVATALNVSVPFLVDLKSKEFKEKSKTKLHISLPKEELVLENN